MMPFLCDSLWSILPNHLLVATLKIYLGWAQANHIFYVIVLSPLHNEGNYYVARFEIRCNTNNYTEY